MLHIQLKGMTNAATSNRIFCPYIHPRPLGWSRRSKQCFSLKVVMLHIQLKGMELRAPCKHIFCPYTHTRPLGWGQTVKLFLLKVVMLHIKFKGKWNIEHNASTYSVLTHTLNPQMGSKCQNIFSESCQVTYQIKGIGAQSTEIS